MGILQWGMGDGVWGMGQWGMGGGVYGVNGKFTPFKSCINYKDT